MYEYFKKILGNKLVRPERVGLLFEEIHLKKFFAYYKVDCVFDVGANTGQYATMLRKQVGYTGNIISFEPMPRAAEVLRKKAEGDPQWYVEEMALDEVSGTAVFNVMKSDQFSSLHLPSEKEVAIFKNNNVVVNQISVQTRTLGEMFEKYKKIFSFTHSFLKMDTQGNDIMIAKGSEDYLKNFVGLQSELSIKKIYKNTSNYSETIEYYISQNFELSALVPNNEGHFPHLVEIDCIMHNTLFRV